MRQLESCKSGDVMGKLLEIWANVVLAESPIVFPLGEKNNHEVRLARRVSGGGDPFS